MSSDQPQPPTPKWGDPISGISPARQQELRDLAARQRQWAAQETPDREKSAFESVELNGAEVFFLAASALADPNGDVEAAATRLRAVKALNPTTWVDLSALHLEGAFLREAHLEGASLGAAHLEGAFLRAAHLEGAFLRAAHLEGASLAAAHLERASLGAAHLEGADLYAAHLEGASLAAAHLERAFLGEAHLEGASLGAAHLERADLRRAYLDSKTILEATDLGQPRSRLARLLRRPSPYGDAALGDIHWEGRTDLTQIHWDTLQRLGDERDVTWRSKVDEHRVVVRAYRQVATQLRDQGMNEEADRFAERAQIRKRKLQARQLLGDWRRPWLLPFDLGRWLFSWFLALLAGYGYRPGRSLVAYILVILGFAFLYAQLGLTNGHSLDTQEAIVISMTAFHGRGFFPNQFLPGDPQAAVAAAEAFLGLIIEVSFIATFTQRFFGAK